MRVGTGEGDAVAVADGLAPADSEAVGLPVRVCVAVAGVDGEAVPLADAAAEREADAAAILAETEAAAEATIDGAEDWLAEGEATGDNVATEDGDAAGLGEAPTAEEDGAIDAVFVAVKVIAIDGPGDAFVTLLSSTANPFAPLPPPTPLSAETVPARAARPPATAATTMIAATPTAASKKRRDTAGRFRTGGLEVSRGSCHATAGDLLRGLCT